MQRTAQDWLVLTELTHRNATAVGIVTALQFGPQIVLLPFTGLAADRLDRRKILLATQGVMGLLALALGLLVTTGVVQLWHVYVLALLLGCATAFDSPARQTFVSELVEERNVANAVALNSTSFNAARTIGPALAGGMIATLGTGWVFLINAASYVAVLVSLCVLRPRGLQAGRPAAKGLGGLTGGFRYVRRRPDLSAVFLMLLFFCVFGLNYQIFISTMVATVFHSGAGAYGALSSTMAVGSVLGALLAARRERPSVALLAVGAAVFSVALGLAALMPTYWLFGAFLIVVGVCGQTMTTSAIGLVQLTTDLAMRGRVVAILLAISLGGLAVGAPIVGWVADRLGPRWALGVGACSGVAAALIGAVYLARSVQPRLLTDWRQLRLSLGHARLRER